MRSIISASAVLFLAIASPASAQDVPADYQQVLTALGRSGDFKANVLKVNIPRNDLSITVANVKTPTPFGFGGWVAMTKGTGGMEVLMGDLVLTQDEVNPVMSALLDNGIEVRLPESDAAAALTALVRLDRDNKILTRDIAAIDLRLPDRVTVQLSDEAAAARAEALKAKAPKKKGGAA